MLWFIVYAHFFGKLPINTASYNVSSEQLGETIWQGRALYTVPRNDNGIGKQLNISSTQERTREVEAVPASRLPLPSRQTIGTEHGLEPAICPDYLCRPLDRTTAIFLHCSAVYAGIGVEPVPSFLRFSLCPQFDCRFCGAKPAFPGT
jgi:hypothetical protein